MGDGFCGSGADGGLDSGLVGVWRGLWGPAFFGWLAW